MQSDKAMKGHLTMLCGTIRRWYFRVFPRYRRLEFGGFGYVEANMMLASSAGKRESERWQLALPEEDHNPPLSGVVYLERRERITE